MNKVNYRRQCDHAVRAWDMHIEKPGVQVPFQPLDELLSADQILIGFPSASCFDFFSVICPPITYCAIILPMANEGIFIIIIIIIITRRILYVSSGLPEEHSTKDGPDRQFSLVMLVI